MKRILASVLVVVMLLGAIGFAAFAESYSETYNVSNTFFDISYSTLVPDVNTVEDWGATGYYSPGTVTATGTAYIGSAARFTYMLEEGEEWADIYVYICGDGWITNEDETLGTYEFQDASGYGTSAGGDLLVETCCEESGKAVKTHHSVTIEDENGRYDSYESTYICPRYYDLFN